MSETTKPPIGRSVEALVSEQQPEIVRYIRMLVGNQADAEDLTQETLLRAHDQRHTLRDPGSIRSWVRQIATNVCTDFLRSSARRSAIESSNDDVAALETPADVPSTELLLDQVNMSQCGEELMRQLPPANRRVLVLHDYMGLTSVEIASILGTTPGAVKIRLHRARARFRALLEQACEFYRDDTGALVGAPKCKNDGS